MWESCGPERGLSPHDVSSAKLDSVIHAANNSLVVAAKQSSAIGVGRNGRIVSAETTTSLDLQFVLSEVCAFEQLAALPKISALIHALTGSRSPSCGEDCGSIVITTTTATREVRVRRIRGTVRSANMKPGYTSIAVALADSRPAIGAIITAGTETTILREISLTMRLTRSLPARTSLPRTRTPLTNYEVNSKSEPTP